MTKPSIRALATASLLGVIGALLAAGPSAGQLPILPTTTTTEAETSSTSSSSTSSTSSTIPNPVTTTTQPEESTTTTEPQQEPEPIGPPEVTVPGEPSDPSPDDIYEVDGLPVPAWAIEKMNSVQRSGGNSTGRVLEKLEALLAFGFTPEETALLGLGQFPVRGEASFADDWWNPRWTPEFHLHLGTDIFAAFETPVTAPVDGVLTMGEGQIGGKYTYLTLEDGTYYYFAHLDSLPELPDEDLITDPDEVARYTFRQFDQPVAYRVQEGDVIGTVGDSGNAEGGAPHLHFEVHPASEDGEAINPKPILDEWLAEAEASVDEVLSLYTTGGPRAVVDTRRTRAAGQGPFTAPSRPLSAEILGVSSLGPGTGVQVVTEEVVRAVGKIDWERNQTELARPMNEVGAALLSSLSG